MDPGRWSRLREVLEAALDAPERDRAAVLDRVCDDEELRREAESLLAAPPHALKASSRAMPAAVVCALNMVFMMLPFEGFSWGRV